MSDLQAGPGLLAYAVTSVVAGADRCRTENPARMSVGVATLGPGCLTVPIWHRHLLWLAQQITEARTTAQAVLDQSETALTRLPDVLGLTLAAQRCPAHAARAAADIEEGTDAAFQHCLVGCRGLLVPPVDRHTDSAPVGQPWVHRFSAGSQGECVRILIGVVQLVLVRRHGAAPCPAAGRLSLPWPARRTRRNLIAKASAEAAKSTPVIASHRPR